ncbi:hypothetical protein [Nocardia sp. NPDC051981]|uniref:hypothetical protein n=1 Tax=Nocardia sp. NPDC051981 TaxID=3155417 RepID=UPI00342CEC27
MASRDIVVTVCEDDWLALNDAAECAGMSVEAYLSWEARLFAFALQARPGTRHDSRAAGPRPGWRASGLIEDESETAAWTQTFAQRVSSRGDRHPPDNELWP